MCFPGRGTHITRDMCFLGGKHISLGICVSQTGEHISLGICVFQVGEHISAASHITRDMCFPGRGSNVRVIYSYSVSKALS